MIHSGKSWGLLLVLGSAGLLGCDRLPKPTALQETGVESGLTEFQVTYQCEDDVSFTARLSDEDAIADLPEQPGVVLPRVTSASGAKYSDGTTTLWDKGGEAFVEVEGAMLLADCQTTELVKTSASPTSEAAVPAADAANLDEEAVGGFPSQYQGELTATAIFTPLARPAFLFLSPAMCLSAKASSILTARMALATC